MAGSETGRSVKWAVGVITCARSDGSLFLNRTIPSIRNAGWSDDLVTIFAEPKSPIPSEFDGHVVERRKTHGDWTNWATGLFELLLSEPDADYFLMSEDDVLYNRDSRAYLEFSFPHLGDFGSLSLYTPSKYSKKKFRGWHNECRGVETWSTQTVIMSKESVIRFFTYKDTIRHRFQDIFHAPEIKWGVSGDPKNSVKDAVIGHWATHNNLPVYFHTPALAQHIGTTSTIDANFHKSDNFVGEDTKLDFKETKVLKFWRVPL